jgi:hypothetical protein
MHVYAHLGQVEQLVSLAPVYGASRLTEAERCKLVEVAGRVGADPDLLAAVISLESGFDPSIVNRACLSRTGDPNQCATGLIQFLPSTARGLGTTVAALREMSAWEQLDFVERYYGRSRISVPGDEYVVTFAPAFVGRPDSTPVFSRGQDAYAQNSQLDLNRDGVITVGELRARVLNRVAAVQGRPRLPVQMPCTAPPPRPGRGISAALLPPLLIAGAGVALFWGTLRAPVQRAARSLARQTR